MSDISSAYRIFLSGGMTHARCLYVCVLPFRWLPFMHKNSFPEVKNLYSRNLQNRMPNGGKTPTETRCRRPRDAFSVIPSCQTVLSVSPQTLSCLSAKPFPYGGTGFSVCRKRLFRASVFSLSSRALRQTVGRQCVTCKSQKSRFPDKNTLPLRIIAP